MIEYSVLFSIALLSVCFSNSFKGLILQLQGNNREETRKKKRKQKSRKEKLKIRKSLGQGESERHKRLDREVRKKEG